MGTVDFEQATSHYRRELLAHCYRMLGSVHDAEDLVQETMLRAWRAYDRYDARRASVRTWLYGIATNACITALQSRSRRPLPSDFVTAGDDPFEAFRPGLDVPWLSPIPDAMVTDDPNDPASIVGRRQSLRLAFIAAAQLLPARQRAALLLHDILRLPATEIAVVLETSPQAVNSLLQRARANLEAGRVDESAVREPDDAAARRVIDGYVEAFLAADVAGLTRLLADDVVLEMPPMLNWYRGHDDYGDFMRRVWRTRGTDWRTRVVRANGGFAMASYVRTPEGDYTAHSIQVFDVERELIGRATVYQDPSLFALWELAPTLKG
jgi:RNA polymerase sigma-70 factor (ECF subfamily)